MRVGSGTRAAELDVPGLRALMFQGFRSFKPTESRSSTGERGPLFCVDPQSLGSKRFGAMAPTKANQATNPCLDAFRFKELGEDGQDRDV